MWRAVCWSSASSQAWLGEADTHMHVHTHFTCTCTSHAHAHAPTYKHALADHLYWRVALLTALLLTYLLRPSLVESSLDEKRRAKQKQMELDAARMQHTVAKQHWKGSMASFQRTRAQVS